ncbi:MAG: hypothetical protein ABI775_02710 [Pseudonocardiales bacterium]|nr:hypothetical protein [Actinomycetota bacterium]
MYAQLTYFDGPRSAELVAAGERAGRERVQPAIAAHPELADQLVASYAFRQPDGGEVIVVITKTEQALRAGREFIDSMDLLPGEDPALLPGPDRVEFYEVVSAVQGPMGQPS